MLYREIGFNHACNHLDVTTNPLHVTTSQVLYREIDFNHERESCERFRQNFESNKAIKVRVAMKFSSIAHGPRALASTSPHRRLTPSA